MSNNAHRFAPTARTLREIARADYEDSREDWGPVDLFSRYVSVEGLAALVKSGTAAWGEEATFFPWNIYGFTETGFCHSLRSRHGRRLPMAEAGEKIAQFARFGGWLKAAAEFPGIRKLFSKNLSSRGVGSPATRIDPWVVAQRFPSPGNFERRLWKVKKSAEKILSAYEGQKPSWLDCYRGLLGNGNQGKAALIAVALTLGWEDSWGTRVNEHPSEGSPPTSAYKKARGWLIQSRKAGKILDTSDGVEMWLSLEPVLVKGGVAVYSGFTHSQDKYRQGCREGMFLVRFGDRTYHSLRSEAKCALTEAVRAWREQDRLAEMHADLYRFLKGEKGFSPIFYRQDSYRAGNCEAGTEAFVSGGTWSGRKFIPGIYLLPYLADERVRRVVSKKMELLAA